ncbi:MAG TPA: hypothetical protein VL625_09445 [Patescibacteria group bacterium]|nr:hypothetical protein [Patescibacteria group bacterium]
MAEKLSLNMPHQIQPTGYMIPCPVNSLDRVRRASHRATPADDFKLQPRKLEFFRLSLNIKPLIN